MRDVGVFDYLFVCVCDYVYVSDYVRGHMCLWLSSRHLEGSFACLCIIDRYDFVPWGGEGPIHHGTPPDGEQSFVGVVLHQVPRKQGTET